MWGSLRDVKFSCFRHAEQESIEAGWYPMDAGPLDDGRRATVLSDGLVLPPEAVFACLCKPRCRAVTPGLAADSVRCNHPGLPQVVCPRFSAVAARIVRRVASLYGSYAGLACGDLDRP
jgi:hypothetical protein